MDFQSIIKQVLSLAELVIKNPSTSLQSSGFNIGSLISMLGGGQQGGGLGSILGGLAGMAGGGNNQSQGGGLGSILGGLAGMAAGAANNNNNQQQSQGGGLGSILGGLAGMAAGAANNNNQQQSQGGGLGSILGGLAGMAAGAANNNQQTQQQSQGGLLGDLLAKASTIKNMLGGDQASKLNNEQKTNLTDMLGVLNLASGIAQASQEEKK